MEALGFPPNSLPELDSSTDLDGRPWTELAAYFGWRSPQKTAAVAILFCRPTKNNEAAPLILTRRSSQLNSHRAQISLAGGRMENGDDTPFKTASREVCEELGIKDSELSKLSVCQPVQSIDGSNIIPVVMLAHTTAERLAPSHQEVEEVIAQPWKLYRRSNVKEHSFNLFGRERKSFIFPTPQGNVWGITAKILWKLNLK